MSGQAVSEGSNPSETTNPFQSTQPGLGELPASAPALNMDQLVPVKIDGVEKQIPLREALNGYAAHEKVTQTTQELAQYKQKVQQFETFVNQLNADPEGMLKDLAARYKVALSGTRNADNLDDDTDPVLAEVAQLKQVISGLQSQVTASAQTQQVRNELETLKQKYGDSFKPDAVVTYATVNNIANLDHAFKLMQYENNSQTQTPTATATAATLGNIAPGTPTNMGPTPKPVETSPSSVREAALRAAESLGFNLEPV